MRNKLETEIKQDVNDVGTGDTCGTKSKQCRYLPHWHFVLFEIIIYLAFFQLILQWQVQEN